MSGRSHSGALALALALPGAVMADLTIYPAPTGAPVSSGRYEVAVRQAEGEWRPVDVYCFFEQYVYNWGRTSEPHLAYFDSDGPVEVRVRVKKPFRKVVVRPLSRKVPQKVDGKEIVLRLSDAARQVVVEPDGDPFHALLLFTNPVDRTPPDPEDPNVLYFGPGYHRAGAIAVEEKLRPVVYIAGGAVVEGSLAVRRCADLAVTGRGILFTPKEHGKVPLLVDGSSGGSVGNIMVLSRDENWTFWYHGSDSIEVRDVKVVGEIRDGINVINSNNVHIVDCYSQSHDDCFCIKGNIWSRVGVDKVLIERCIANNIAGGNGMDIGHDLDAPYVRDLVFRDIDIIHNLHPEGAEAFEYYPTAAISIHPTSDVHARNAEVANVLYEDIRVEDNGDQWLIDIWTRKPGAFAVKGVRNVVFRNIRRVGGAWKPIRLHGNDQAIIRDIRFEAVYDGDRLISGSDPGDVEMNEFVERVSF